jgi:hypothetical protein
MRRALFGARFSLLNVLGRAAQRYRVLIALRAARSCSLITDSIAKVTKEVFVPARQLAPIWSSPTVSF